MASLFEQNIELFDTSNKNEVKELIDEARIIFDPPKILSETSQEKTIDRILEEEKNGRR